MYSEEVTGVSGMKLILALMAGFFLFSEMAAARGFDAHDLSGIWMRTVRDHSERLMFPSR
jgi:hypothetical protein